MVYYYFFISIIIFLFLVKLFIKIKFKFWAEQPVFHYYNLFYWLSSNRIINNNLPIANKYCNFINIICKDYFEFNETQLKMISNLLQNNYCRSENIDYIPSEESFKSNFIGHNKSCLVGIYNEDIYNLKDNKFMKEKKIIGMITGRPVYITLKKELLNAYYVDYLCVDKNFRNKNIAPQLIQTYEFVQRKKVQDSKVSLFKREGILTGIVPLTVYKSYKYNINYITSKEKRIDLLKQSSRLVEISEVNYDLMREIINSKKFLCKILITETNLLNLIKNKVYKIYGLISNNILLGCYIFRENNLIIKEDNKEYSSIDLLGSLINGEKSNFVKGFELSISAIKKDIKNIKYLNIENISDNDIILNYLDSKSFSRKYSIPMAYFLYNYIHKPILSNNVLILI